MWASLPTGKMRRAVVVTPYKKGRRSDVGIAPYGKMRRAAVVTPYKKRRPE